MPACGVFDGNGILKTKSVFDNMTGEGVRNLCSAVIHLAFLDYVEALMNTYKNPQSPVFSQKKRELEHFFCSERYKSFTDIPPKKLMERGEEVAKERFKKWTVNHPVMVGE